MPERIEKRADRQAVEAYEWQINRIPLPEGGFGVVCYFRDISAQVRARLQLENADRQKDEFLAMLAHELRNPLAPIRTASELLKRTPQPDEAIVKSYTEIYAPAMVSLLADGLAILTLLVARIPIIQKLAILCSFWIISIFVSVVTLHPIILSFTPPPEEHVPGQRRARALHVVDDARRDRVALRALRHTLPWHAGTVARDARRSSRSLAA